MESRFMGRYVGAAGNGNLFDQSEVAEPGQMGGGIRIVGQGRHRRQGDRQAVQGQQGQGSQHRGSELFQQGLQQDVFPELYGLCRQSVQDGFMVGPLDPKGPCPATPRAWDFRQPAPVRGCEVLRLRLCFFEGF